MCESITKEQKDANESPAPPPRAGGRNWGKNGVNFSYVFENWQTHRSPGPVQRSPFIQRGRDPASHLLGWIGKGRQGAGLRAVSTEQFRYEDEDMRPGTGMCSGVCLVCFGLGWNTTPLGQSPSRSNSKITNFFAFATVMQSCIHALEPMHCYHATLSYTRLSCTPPGCVDSGQRPPPLELGEAWRARLPCLPTRNAPSHS